MLRKLRLWYDFKGRYTLRKLRKGLFNLYTWFWIVWTDRDFDYSFIYKLLRFKLRRTRKTLLRNSRFEGVEHTVRYIKIAEDLIQKVSEGYYELEPYDYIKTEFMWHEIEGTDTYRMESRTLEDNLDDYFSKYPKLYKKHSQVESDRIKVYLSMSIELQNKAKRLLFKIIEEKIEEWWD